MGTRGVRRSSRRRIQRLAGILLMTIALSMSGLFASSASADQAIQTEVSAKQSGENVILARIPFVCIVPRNDAAPCGQAFDVPQGWILQVERTNSGGNQVYFQARRNSNGDALAPFSEVEPGGPRVAIWGNNTGGRVRVRVWVTSLGNDTSARGDYITT